MKYSIFHTSHCGSTLLACLLSKSIPTLTEPDWSHAIRDMKHIDTKMAFVNANCPDNTLVKYSSHVCDIAPHLDGKKVFLYRNLYDHMAMLSDKFGADMITEGRFWHKRLGYVLECDDVMFIESEYFLANQQEIAAAVCKHFGIEYVPVEIDYHVKEAGLNNRNTPIEL